MALALRLPNSKPVSTNQKIFRAALTVGSLSIIARAATVFREMVVARWFGRGDALDAFLISFLLPSFVVMLITGSLSSAAVPVILQTRRDGEEARNKLLSEIVLLSAAVLSATAIFLAVLAPYYLPWIAHGFSPVKLELTRKLLYLLLPWLVFNGLATVVSFILNSDEKFAIPAMTPLLTPIVTMVVVIAAAQLFGPFAIAAGTVAGSVLEASLLFYLLRKHGVRLRLRWTGIDSRLRSILTECAPLAAGAVLTVSTPVVDQAMAAMLPSGSVSALSYGNKLIGAIVALGANALGTALLPYFSRMAVEHDWFGCRHTLKRYFVIVLSATIPVTAALIALSHPIIRLLYQRGAFNAADTQLVSWIQICYAFQIPSNLIGILFVRFISAVRRNDLLMYVAGFNLVINVVLNLALMRLWGVAGIALSTSLVYLLSAALLAAISVRLLGQERAIVVAQTNPAGQ
jgi:putative peptidoglycan lipid II flippase